MSTETPEQVLGDAEREISEADKALAALEDRVRAGDDQVQPEEIERARGLRRFAALRKEAAEKRAADLRQEQIDAKYRERADTFRESVQGLSIHNLARLHRAAEDALDALATACETRDAAVLKGSVSLAGVEQSTLNVKAVPYSGVRIGDESWAMEPAGPLIARLIRAVAERHDGLPVANSTALRNQLSLYSAVGGEVEKISAGLRASAEQG
ncbi:hypothetical protein ABZS86_02370 [Streptomyces sp. NPDC005355]|uniref:hypothetical protein n=1 Tax=Streptomyces sp. NPDC005355 TaxID=3157038 RepID=UPI0033BC1F87